MEISTNGGWITGGSPMTYETKPPIPKWAVGGR